MWESDRFSVGSYFAIQWILHCCWKTWTNSEENLRTLHSRQQCCEPCFCTVDHIADFHCLRIHFLNNFEIASIKLNWSSIFGQCELLVLV
uniref:Uncharacterized protein n=1 Tax=Salix viminalis TaxID=40686 RepID=A0A6N2N551_SALVM